MGTFVYNIRLDDELKSEAFSVFDGYGISPAQAIRLFLKQTAETKKIPISFDYQASESTLEALAEIENGGGTVYNSLEEMVADVYHA